MYKTAIKLVFFLIFLLLGQSLFAQQLRKTAENNQFTEYHFTNDSLAVVHSYEFIIPDGMNQSFSIVQQSVVTHRVQEDPEILSNAYALNSTDTPLFDIVNPGMKRGQKVANLRFHPARYQSTDSDEFLIVREAKFRVYKEQDRQRIIPQQQAASIESSPFNSGNWYKIPLTESGIYQIDADYLEEIGINLSSINPQNIQIWATPGGELPRLNSADRPHLEQIPVIVEGESNGSFDQGDLILFYAESPNQIFRDSDTGSFSHQLHRYSDFNHVFLTVGSSPGERLTVTQQPSGAQTITEFRDFIYSEEEIFKSEARIRSGLEWYSQRFSTSASNRNQTIFSESVPGIISGREFDIEIQFVGRSTQSMSMTFRHENSELGSTNVSSITSYTSQEGISGRLAGFSSTSTLNSDVINLSAQLNATESSSEAFIDWVRVSFDRNLVADNGFLKIYAPTNVQNQTAVYSMSGFSSTPLVMEVTDAQQPVLLNVSESGNNFQFSYSHSSSNRFVAQSEFFTPEPGELIQNQNLRGISHHPDYVIVTSEFFLDLAQEWAAYRQQQDNFETVVVTQNQIFNEFGGGTPEVTAIRDYIKFLYDRALNSGQEPLQHLLLFGDATYDFKNIVNGSYTNHVFTFQSDESLHRIDSYGSDDYYGLLDDDEGEWTRFGSSERIDIGIGRFPVNTLSEAQILMNKIRVYESAETSGDWRTRFAFAADNDLPDVERNRDLHTLNADGTAIEIDKTETATRIDKIYMLSYPVETSAAGRRVPGATQDFLNAFNRGSLVVNYSGHGNENVLSDERLFTDQMIPQLTNRERQSIFVTATCSFGRFDDAEARSGAEKVLLWENGGTVATYTTTRVVFTSSSPGSNNFGLNIQLTRQMVEREETGKPQRLGDIYRRTKNTTQGAGFNARKFILLGDPAMRIGLPEKRAKITTINNVNLEENPDTLIQVRALDKLTFSGIVSDENGNPLMDYNGEANVTVFDAERIVNLPNRPWVQEGRCFMSDCRYSVESDVLFNGRVTVQGGQFQSEFIVPADISFSENSGRILAYTSSTLTDASGSTANLFFNDVNPDAEDDSDGPEIDIYLNDKNFVNGNLVGNSPTLYVELEDQSGINTTGTGVGHEIIATIDTNPRKTIVLNEFYQSELDDFQRGRIEYPLESLPSGNYTLTVRAWDVYNNPSENTIHFEVADSDRLEIRNVYNYPNPMHNRTRFVFEHNQPGNLLDIDIRIFTLSGAPVTHLKESQITSNSYANIEWNGLDRDYDRLANGTYIYVLRVGTDTPEGRQTKEKIEKLVVIR